MINNNNTKPNSNVNRIKLVIYIKNNYTMCYSAYSFLKNSTFKCCNEFIKGEDGTKIGKLKCIRYSYLVWHYKAYSNNNIFIN